MNLNLLFYKFNSEIFKYSINNKLLLIAALGDPKFAQNFTYLFRPCEYLRTWLHRRIPKWSLGKQVEDPFHSTRMQQSDKFAFFNISVLGQTI